MIAAILCSVIETKPSGSSRQRSLSTNLSVPSRITVRDQQSATIQYYCEVSLQSTIRRQSSYSFSGHRYHIGPCQLESYLQLAITSASVEVGYAEAGHNATGSNTLQLDDYKNSLFLACPNFISVPLNQGLPSSPISFHIHDAFLWPLPHRCSRLGRSDQYQHLHQQ